MNPLKLAAACLLAVTMLPPPKVLAQQPPSDRSGQQEKEPSLAPVTSRRVLLKEGTPIHLKLAQKLTSKTATVGELVEFVLAEDLKVDGYIVARKGTRALGVVAKGKKSEKQKLSANQLALRLDHMKVGDTVIQLRGEHSSPGKRDAGKIVAFTVLFGLYGLAASSRKNFVIPEGAPVTAYVDENCQLPVLGPPPPDNPPGGSPPKP